MLRVEGGDGVIDLLKGENRRAGQASNGPQLRLCNIEAFQVGMPMMRG
jgi:hypothetical protein